jgi:predicted nuclease of predicted toxin-antitoxin system
MAKFLIDANLPYRFSLWHGPDYIHVFDLNDQWSDWEIWDYAKLHNLIIVTKDADFYDRILLSEPPPKVVHLQIGNMRMRDLFAFLNSVWPHIQMLSESHKLVVVRKSEIEAVE